MNPAIANSLEYENISHFWTVAIWITKTLNWCESWSGRRKYASPQSLDVIKSKKEWNSLPYWCCQTSFQAAGLKLFHGQTSYFRMSSSTVYRCPQRLLSWIYAHPDHSPQFLYFGQCQRHVRIPGMQAPLPFTAMLWIVLIWDSLCYLWKKLITLSCNGEKVKSYRSAILRSRLARSW